jgi:hypothetical protein
MTAATYHNAAIVPIVTATDSAAIPKATPDVIDRVAAIFAISFTGFLGSGAFAREGIS